MSVTEGFMPPRGGYEVERLCVVCYDNSPETEDEDDVICAGCKEDAEADGE